MAPVFTAKEPTVARRHVQRGQCHVRAIVLPGLGFGHAQTVGNCFHGTERPTTSTKPLVENGARAGGTRHAWVVGGGRGVQDHLVVLNRWKVFVHHFGPHHCSEVADGHAGEPSGFVGGGGPSGFGVGVDNVGNALVNHQFGVFIDNGGFDGQGGLRGKKGESGGCFHGGGDGKAVGEAVG